MIRPFTNFWLPESKWWQGDVTNGLEIPFGLQLGLRGAGGITLDDDIQHAYIIGAENSGKDNLVSIIMEQVCCKYHPLNLHILYFGNTERFKSKRFDELPHVTNIYGDWATMTNEVLEIARTRKPDTRYLLIIEGGSLLSDFEDFMWELNGSGVHVIRITEYLDNLDVLSFFRAHAALRCSPKDSIEVIGSICAHAAPALYGYIWVRENMMGSAEDVVCYRMPFIDPARLYDQQLLDKLISTHKAPATAKCLVDLIVNHP